MLQGQEGARVANILVSLFFLALGKRVAVLFGCCLS